MRQSSFVLLDDCDHHQTIALTACHGFHSASMAVSGAFLGMVKFWAGLTEDELFEIQGVNSKNGIPQAGTTMRGLFSFDCRGFNYIGCELKDWTSGAVTVHGVLSD